jgi:hypothetical protein
LKMSGVFIIKMWTEDFIFLFNALRIGAEKIFGVTISPSVLICDASKSIQNAFKHAFGSETTSIMCWAHMKKKRPKKQNSLCDQKFSKKRLVCLLQNGKKSKMSLLNIFKMNGLCLIETDSKVFKR